MSSPFKVHRLLSHGGASVIGIVRTMCHMITDVTTNHLLSSRTVRVLPVRQFAVRSQFAKYSHPNYATLTYTIGIVFVISEVIFVFDLQCRQYREIRHISAYTQLNSTQQAT